AIGIDCRCHHHCYYRGLYLRAVAVHPYSLTRRGTHHRVTVAA
ncbi:sulfate transporter family protein, partial [Vibrio parahaemolyticus VP2007-007]